MPHAKTDRPITVRDVETWALVIAIGVAVSKALSAIGFW
jgi:hypothetical protein